MLILLLESAVEIYVYISAVGKNKIIAVADDTAYRACVCGRAYHHILMEFVALYSAVGIKSASPEVNAVVAAGEIKSAVGVVGALVALVITLTAEARSLSVVIVVGLGVFLDYLPGAVEFILCRLLCGGYVCYLNACHIRNFVLVRRYVGKAGKQLIG